MSLVFTVPIIVYAEVRVPDTGDLEKDRQKAADAAGVFGRHRIMGCSMGTKKKSVSVMSITVEYPTSEGFADPCDKEKK